MSARERTAERTLTPEVCGGHVGRECQHGQPTWVQRRLPGKTGSAARNARVLKAHGDYSSLRRSCSSEQPNSPLLSAQPQPQPAAALVAPHPTPGSACFQLSGHPGPDSALPVPNTARRHYCSNTRRRPTRKAPFAFRTFLLSKLGSSGAHPNAQVAGSRSGLAGLTLRWLHSRRPGRRSG